MYPSAGDTWSTQITELITASVAQPPVLQITRTGNSVAVSWSASFTGFQLQSTSNLTATPAWSNVTTTPVQNGNQFVVTLPATASQQFFRLIKLSTARGADSTRHILVADFGGAFEAGERFQEGKATSPVGPLRCLATSRFTATLLLPQPGRRLRHRRHCWVCKANRRGRRPAQSSRTRGDREPRLPIFIFFQFAVELAEDDDGDIQLFGNGFEAVGDIGDFLLTILGPARGGVQELEVIDHKKFHAVLLGHAACLSPELEDGEPGRIIDEQGARWRACRRRP